jgi:hypothetical protein
MKDRKKAQNMNWQPSTAKKKSMDCEIVRILNNTNSEVSTAKNIMDFPLYFGHCTVPKTGKEKLRIAIFSCCLTSN